MDATSPALEDGLGRATCLFRGQGRIITLQNIFSPHILNLVRGRRIFEYGQKHEYLHFFLKMYWLHHCLACRPVPWVAGYS